MPTFSVPRLLALVAGLALALGTRRAPADAPAAQLSDPLTLTGHDWSRLSPEERNAYLIGFIAGAAAQQASPTGTTPGTAPTSGRDVARRAVALKRSGSLTFPYRENVYRSHLDDYFFYQDRRTEALIQVLVDMHATARPGR